MRIFIKKGGIILKISIAIDGPAGSGKSTIAKLLAAKYDIMYINTGAMYRAVTYEAVRNNISHTDVRLLCDLIDHTEMHFEGDRIIINGKDITEKITLPDISKKVSDYAAVPEVREKLVEQQKNMAKKYSIVMDGRDIGTVVLKNADLKFFLTAKPEERAKRRYEELKAKGISVNLKEILNEINKRDYIDSNRLVSPLTIAEDAIEIDTSNLNIDQVVNQLSCYINHIKGDKNNADNTSR